MHCPKCGADNFEFSNPCVQCSFKGEARLLEEWAGLDFLLKELATWQDIPDFYRDRLRKKYGKQRREVEIQLGLRQPPLNKEAARATRQALTDLRTFTLSEMKKWVEHGWLTPEVALKLGQDFDKRILTLQERLVDAPAPDASERSSAYIQARLQQLQFQLRILESLHKADRLAVEGVYEAAREMLTVELHQVEIKLGLRQPPPKPKPIPGPQTAEPSAPVKQPPPSEPTSPPRLPRQPLTWDRVWETLLSERTLRAILFLGATLLFAAAVSLVIWNWETFPPWLQVTFLASFTTAFYGLGWYVRSKMKLRVSGIALSGVASLLVPLDFYAFYLSGGFLGLVWSDVWLLTSAVCFAAYLLTVYLIQADFFGYLVGLAAGSLLAALLQFWGIEQAWWVAALSGLTLVLGAAGFFLSHKRLKILQKWQVLTRPFWHLAVGGVTAVLTLSTSLSILGQAGGSAYLTSLAVSWWLGGLVYLLALGRFQMRLVAMAAALSFPIAALLTQRQLYTAWEVNAAWYALGWALMTPAYLFMGRRLLNRTGSSQPGTDDMNQAYGRIALFSCVVLMLISFSWALGDAGAMGLVHLILALTTIGAARLWQRPNFLFFTSLFLMSAAAGWVSTIGGTIGYLGLGWALLAIGHIAAALRLTNKDTPSPYAVPLFRGGWVIGALALLPPLVTQERPILTYALANWIGLNGWLALLLHEGRLNLAHFWPTIRRRLLRLPDLTFQWAAALLLLPWLWLSWINNRPTSTLLGLTFLALAWLLMGLGNRLRRARWRYGRPWFVAAQLSVVLAVLAVPFEFDQRLAAVLFLLSAVFYVASTRILHNRWWLVLAGLAFPAGLILGRDWLAVPVDPLLFSLSLTVLAYFAGPRLLERYRGLSGRYQQPLTAVAYFIAAAVFVFSVGRVAMSDRSDSILLWMSATEAVLALAAGIYAWFDAEEGFGHVAAWLGVLSGGLLAATFSQGSGSSAAKAALIAVVYIVGERVLRQAALKRNWPWRPLAGRGWRQFRRPILQAGWGVSFIAIFLALFRNMLFLGGGVTRETWAIIALLLITGLYLTSSWLYRRYIPLSGRRVWWAAVLVFFPWTLLTHQGWYIAEGPKLVTSYAVAWALLALAQLAIAVWLTIQAVDKRWIKPPKVVAYVLLPVALLWGIGNAAVSSLTFGLGVVFYLLAVYSDWLWRMVPVRKTKLDTIGVPRNRFLYVAAILVPVWAAYSLENYSPGAARSTFGMLLLAHSLPFWLVGRWVERRERAYRMPLYLAAYGTAALGTMLVLQNQPVLIGALLFDALLGLLSARFFKQPLWLFVTVVTLPAAWLLTLDEWNVTPNRFGWGLLGLSQLYLLIAWWLSTRNRTDKERLVQKVSTVAIPFLAGMFGLIAFGLLLSSQDRLGIQIGYLGAVLLLVQTAVWLNQPLLSALAATLLPIPYWFTLTDIGIEWPDYGLALWPLIILYLLLAYALDRFFGRKPPLTVEDELGVLAPFPWYSPAKWLPVALGRLLHWWGLPFFGLALGGAIVAVLLSLANVAQTTITLFLAAFIFGWATACFRLRGWLLLTITAVQLTLVAGSNWLGWWQTANDLALLFLPVTFVTALIGLFIEWRWQEGALFGGDRQIRWQGWSRPFFALLAVNFLIGQLVSINFGNFFLATVEGIWVTLAHILLLVGLAGWWASDLMAAVPVLLGLVALIQLLLFRKEPLTTWPTALALLTLGYGLSGYFLRFFRKIEAGWVQRSAVRIWEFPLLLVGWLISGLSWLLILLAGLNVVALAIRAVFRLPLLSENDIVRVQAVVAVLTLLGLFYLAAAVVERQSRLGYVAMGMLLVAWSLEWGLVWNLREEQWYAIPAGIYLLAVGCLEWRNGSRTLARWIDRLALLLLLGTSFWQSLGPNGWPYALLMGFEGFMITWWGSTRRLRRFLYAGVIGVTIDVSWQLIDPLLTATNRWIVFGIVGVFLVSLAILVERRLEKVMALTKDVRRRLEDWE